MLETNVFQRLFNPDRSDLFGLIGTAVGNPSISSGIAGEVNQQLSDLAQQNGGNLQKAVLQFYSSPQGVQMATQDPKGMDSTVKAWVANTTAPQPQLSSPGQIGTDTTALGGTREVSNNPPLPQQVAPGYTMTNGRTSQPQFQAPYAPTQMGPNTNLTNPNNGATIASTPPAKVSELSGMAEGAGMSPTEKQRLFRSQANTVEGRQGMAIQDMIKAGEISPEWGRKLEAGTLEFKQMRDLFGKENGGWGLFDKATGQMVKQFKDVPNDLKPKENTEAPFDVNKAEDTPHLASGILGMTISEGGKALRQITDKPSAAASDAQLMSERRSQLYDIHAALSELQGSAAGLGPGRESTIKRILNKGPDLGYNVDPKYQLSQLTSLRTDLEKERDADIRLIRGNGDTKGDVVSDTVKSEASARIVAYDRVLRTLPTWSKLSAAKELCDKGNCGGGGLAGAAKEVQAIGVEGAKNVPTSLPTPGKPGIDPAIIPSMTNEDIKKINPDNLPVEQRNLIIKRLQELKGQTQPPSPSGLPTPSPTTPLPQGAVGNPFSGVGSWFNSPRSQYGDEVTPGNNSGVQNFIRNPDGSTKSVSATQSRIDEAFKTLAEAHKNGLLGENPTPQRRKTPPKRRQ